MIFLVVVVIVTPCFIVWSLAIIALGFWVYGHQKKIFGPINETKWNERQTVISSLINVSGCIVPIYCVIFNSVWFRWLHSFVYIKTRSEVHNRLFYLIALCVDFHSIFPQIRSNKQKTQTTYKRGRRKKRNRNNLIFFGRDKIVQKEINIRKKS